MSLKDRRKRGPSYRQAQLAARRQMGVMERSVAVNIQQSMNEYARQVEKIVSGLPASAATDIARLNATTKILKRAAAQLNKQLTTLMGTNRAISFVDVLGIWKEASLEAASISRVPSYLMGGIMVPPVTLLGAYEAVGAAHWRTLLSGHGANAIDDTNTIVRNALLQGSSPRQLAKRLRPYVSGAESFKRAFGGLVPNLNTLSSPELQGAGRRMAFNAKRIAWSEIHNARAEAEVQHFAADPLIRTVAWRLSPDRGSLRGPDECDVYAQTNFYDLGPGVYPVDAVPLPPHSFDRCERVPRVGRPEEFVKPKAMGLPRRSAKTSGVTCHR